MTIDTLTPAQMARWLRETAANTRAKRDSPHLSPAEMELAPHVAFRLEQAAALLDDPCLYGQKNCPGGAQCVCALPSADEPKPGLTATAAIVGLIDRALDEINTLTREPSANYAAACGVGEGALGQAKAILGQSPRETSRDARGFPLSAHGFPIEARCAACSLPMVTLGGDEESFTHDCDCMHRGEVKTSAEAPLPAARDEWNRMFDAWIKHQAGLPSDVPLWPNSEWSQDVAMVAHALAQGGSHGGA